MILFAGIVACAFWLGLWAHWRYALHRSCDEIRASCGSHSWSTTLEVGEPPMGRGPRIYMQLCVRCLEQRHVTADGKQYVPERDR